MRQWNTRQKGRPARSPDYRITIAGQTISPELDARLISLRLTDQRGFESDQLDLTLSDYDGRLEIPPRGASLQVAIGWRGAGLVNKGTFIVNEVEHSGAPDQLTIRARAADLRADLIAKRNQSWHELSIDDIIRTIAARHELTPRVGQDLADKVIQHIDQTDESDPNFLTRLGERYDALATIKAGHLLFMPNGEAQTASGTAIPAVTLRRRDGDQYRYSLSDRDAYTGVVAYWQDTDNAKRETFLVGSNEKPKRLRDTFATEEEATQAAKAEWQRVRRAGASLTLALAEGRPDLYPETPLTARGWKADIDATGWVITQVEHSLTSSAYMVSVQAEVQNNRNI